MDHPSIEELAALVEALLTENVALLRQFAQLTLHTHVCAECFDIVASAVVLRVLEDRVKKVDDEDE